MQLDKYSTLAFYDYTVFVFYSDGPKGRIKKAIHYTKIPNSGGNIFNLAFGDWIENEKRVNDKIVTNNNDRQKILATVASTVPIFFGHHPHAFVYAEGSTASRTRLYQMGILEYLAEITELLNVYGFKNEDWEIFQSGRNYEAFAVKIKT